VCTLSIRIRLGLSEHNDILAKSAFIILKIEKYNPLHLNVCNKKTPDFEVNV